MAYALYLLILSLPILLQGQEWQADGTRNSVGVQGLCKLQHSYVVGVADRIILRVQLHRFHLKFYNFTDM